MSYENLFEAAKTSAGSTSKYFEMLTADQKRDVLEFIEWLKTTDMSVNSVNSYKSYIVKSMLKADGKLEGKLTNDEKSGVRKFNAWFKTQDIDETIVDDTDDDIAEDLDEDLDES